LPSPCRTDFLFGGGLRWLEVGMPYDDEVVRIANAYLRRVPDENPAFLEAEIRHEFEQRSNFPIQDYVSIFVERAVRAHHGLIGATHEVHPPAMS
jgi:hypothetical protein